MKWHLFPAVLTFLVPILIVPAASQAIEPRADMVRFVGEIWPYVIRTISPTEGAPRRCLLQIQAVGLTIIEHVVPSLKQVQPEDARVVGRALEDINQRLHGLVQRADRGCEREAKGLLAESFTLALYAAPENAWVGIATLRLLAQQASGKR